MPPTQPDHPSPKRKRDQPPPMPLLNTALALRPASTPSRAFSVVRPSGADSPQNAVADQLRAMDIAAASTAPMSPLTPVDHGAHKKLRLDVTREGSGTWLAAGLQATDLHSARAVALSPRPGALTEIPETPQAPQPRTLPDTASFAQPPVFVSSSSPTSPQPEPATHQPPDPANPPPHFSSPDKSPPLALSALTWQVSEITGHLADPSTDPDDDGTGLNGIGFKPTPAIAYARSQKRRQQLSEWKAREAREARAKRSERRRRGVGGKASRESTIEREMPVPEANFSQRTVKFAV